MSRYMAVGLAIAALAGCSGVRPGDEYDATDRDGATATVQAQQRCSQAGLAPKELRRFRVYDSGSGRMVDRVYYTCEKPGR